MVMAIFADYHERDLEYNTIHLIDAARNGHDLTHRAKAV